jgi:hypothetical protein
VDRPSVAIIALVVGILAQSSLAGSTRLVAGCLVARGFLVLLSPFLQRRHTSRRGDTFTSIILLVTLVGAGLVLDTLSSFRAAIPLYAVAVILFVPAIGNRFETRLRRAEYRTPWELILLLGILSLGFVLQAYRVALILPGFHGDEGESGMQAL